MPRALKPTALALLLCSLAGPALAASVTFDFTFAPLNPTSEGTGVMTFDDPGDGTHDFFGLSNVSALFEFTVGTESLSFSLANLLTLSGALVVLDTQGDTRTLVFSGSAAPSETGGSLDFALPDQDAVLAFGPTSFMGMYNLQVGTLVTGGATYSATLSTGSDPSVIPLPATLPLLAAGLGALALLRRRVGAD